MSLRISVGSMLSPWPPMMTSWSVGALVIARMKPRLKGTSWVSRVILHHRRIAHAEADIHRSHIGEFIARRGGIETVARDAGEIGAVATPAGEIGEARAQLFKGRLAEPGGGHAVERAQDGGGGQARLSRQRTGRETGPVAQVFDEGGV